jgi:hypothetical protein
MPSKHICATGLFNHQQRSRLMYPNLIRTVHPGKLFESCGKNDQMLEYLGSKKVGLAQNEHARRTIGHRGEARRTLSNCRKVPRVLNF